MCLQTSGAPFAPMSSVIQSFWIVRHTRCKHYFHKIKQSWWLMWSKLPPRQLKVGQYKGSPKHGHWHSRLPKSETKEGVASSLRLHLAFFESWVSSSHLLNILSSGNSYLLSFTSTWAGRGKKLTNGRWEAFWGGYHVFCQGKCQDLHFKPSSPFLSAPPSLTCVLSCQVVSTWDIAIGNCYEMAQLREGLQ